MVRLGYKITEQFSDGGKLKVRLEYRTPGNEAEYSTSKTFSYQGGELWIVDEDESS